MQHGIKTILVCLPADGEASWSLLPSSVSDNIWFDDIDQKVFSFKHKVHNWLKEQEKEHKRDHSSKSSTRSSSSKSKFSTQGKAVEEKLRVAELITEALFMKKKRDTEYQAEALRMKEELAKARARAKVYDDMEGIDLGLGKDAEVFLPKKFEDNEVTLPNMPKGVAFEKTKSRQSGFRTLYRGKLSISNLPILE